MDSLISELKAPGAQANSVPPVGDGFALVNDTTSDAASNTKAGNPTQVTQPGEGEAQSNVANPVAAFGSPHVGSPMPASPLDGAAKQLNFDAPKASPTNSPGYAGLPTSLGAQGAPPTPSTPQTVPMPAAAAAANFLSGDNSEGTVDYDTFVKETLLWVHKVRSGVYLVGGLLLIYALHAALTSNVSIVTGVANALLISCALNTFRAFFSPKLQARSTWQDSVWTNGIINRTTSLVKGVASLHDKHLTGTDAPKMLRIVFTLWLISMAGRLVGAFGLAVVLWITAFVVPKLYTINQAKVDQVFSDVTTQAKTQFQKLDPKARAALVVVPIFVGGYALSSTDLAVAVLALALYGRSWMAPAQVDRLNQAVGPAITNTVSKVGGVVSHFVNGAVVKFDLTPTPAKAKRA